VHHLTPVSELGDGAVDAVRDLRPSARTAMLWSMPFDRRERSRRFRRCWACRSPGRR